MRPMKEIFQELLAKSKMALASRKPTRPRYIVISTSMIMTKNSGDHPHTLTRVRLVPRSKYTPTPSISGGLRRRMAA